MERLAALRQRPSLSGRWKMYAGRTFLVGNIATAGLVGLWQPTYQATQSIPSRHIAGLAGDGGHPPDRPDLCDVNVTYTGRVALLDRETVQTVIAPDDSRDNTYHQLGQPQTIDREQITSYDSSGREQDCTFFTAPDAKNQQGDPDFGSGDVTLTMKQAVVFPGRPNSSSGVPDGPPPPDNIGFMVPWVNAQPGSSGYEPTPTPTPCPDDPPAAYKRS